MTKKTKLELTWIGKDERPRLEPRILLEDPELSYHAAQRVSENDIFDNRLIFGDNLLALKALEQEFAGKVKCVFIDPPYNTGSAFEHYDDGVEHSLWLCLMRDRLEILRRLLSPEGSIWITIDDNEAHYLKVLCDEVFGRGAFVANIVWQKRTSRENRAAIGTAHDHLLVYAPAGPQRWKDHRNRLPANDVGYANPDDDPRGPWRSIPFSAQGYRPNQMYPITTPTGDVVQPPRGRCWGRDRASLPQSSRGEQGLLPQRWQRSATDEAVCGRGEWLSTDDVVGGAEVGDNEAAKKQILALFPEQEPFATPKPEGLLHRIIQIATNSGELVLDSFAGSGTTGAVAHKMGRRWIMVEMGEHCTHSHRPSHAKGDRRRGPGGVTAQAEWKGGGGFRFYRLAPSLLERDKYGNWVISKQYNPAMLAEAMCKHEGFSYAPSDDVYWQHGRSTETDFIYVTTQTLGREQLAQLSEEVGPERSLLVCCAAFRASADEFSNLTIKKIPQAVLNRCEWGRDDYSLAIAHLPDAPASATERNASAETRIATAPRRPGRRAAAPEPELFEEAES